MVLISSITAMIRTLTCFCEVVVVVLHVTRLQEHWQDEHLALVWVERGIRRKEQQVALVVHFDPFLQFINVCDA